ncbi:hypothetical protein GOL96_30100 [Sinorhizobium medicae]|nr:hypothetical protein [Sinorhizobium medicae]MDX1237978.1 hypothetical protein [Sinorhizobium medicae]
MLRLGWVLSLTLTAGTAIGQEAGVVDTPFVAEVDKGRVKNDIAVATQSGFRDTLLFPMSAQFGDFKPAVPLMVPLKLFSDLSAGASFSGGDKVAMVSENSESTVEFDANGFFGSVKYPGYDLTIQGTNLKYISNTDTSSQFSGPQPDYFDFSGDNVSFGYAGADYLITIECTVGDAVCVSENEIKKIIDNFILCDDDNVCVNSFPVKREEQ